MNNKEMNKMEVINRPGHYVGLEGLEVEEVLRNFMPKYGDGYLAHRIASAMEYLLRAPQKNGIEDLRKARKCVDMAIEYMETSDDDQQ